MTEGKITVGARGSGGTKEQRRVQVLNRVLAGAWTWAQAAATRWIVNREHVSVSRVAEGQTRVQVG